MNPKPFFVSNHFTLPDAICFSIHLSSLSPVWQNAVPRASERRCTSKDFGAQYRKSPVLVNDGVDAKSIVYWTAPFHTRSQQAPQTLHCKIGGHRAKN